MKRSEDAQLLVLFRTIASGDVVSVSRMIEASPGIAVDAIRIAASRSDAETYFLEAIRHNVYAGDTALHVAAAAHQRPTTEALIADERARQLSGE